MMKLFFIAARNLKRSWFRTLFTIAGIAVALLAFVMIRTLLWAWSARAEFGAQDRLATRQRVSLIVQLPRKYVSDVRRVPGVAEATWSNWFGGRYPAAPNEFFSTIAVDPESYLKVMTEVKVSDEDKTRWMNDKTGALVGSEIAKKLGWKVGDKVVLEGTFYPGDWEFHISGIYTVKGVGGHDAESFLFHWTYLDDMAPAAIKDQAGWITSRITDDKRSAQISKAIDATFEDREDQTSTMSERTMQAGFLGGITTLLQALDVVSGIILLIMLLILGNTISMGVRERTKEYAVLRAIGFEPRHVRFFIIAEGTALGLLAGLFGLALAYPFVNFFIAPMVFENMGSLLPPLRVQSLTAVFTSGIACALAIVASIPPALAAGRASVTDALRRVG